MYESKVFVLALLLCTDTLCTVATCSSVYVTNETHQSHHLLYAKAATNKTKQAITN